MEYDNDNDDDNDDDDDDVVWNMGDATNKIDEVDFSIPSESIPPEPLIYKNSQAMLVKTIHNYAKSPSKEQSNANAVTDLNIIKNRYEWKLHEKDMEIERLKEKLKKIKNENEELKREKAITKTSCIQQVINESNLPPLAKALAELLLLHKNRKPYTSAQKQICTTIYCMSRRFYNFLMNEIGVPLASRRSIRRWQPVKHVEVGPISESFDLLKNMLNNLKPDDRKGVLCNDEIHGRQGLVYDEASDMLVGFEDIGFGERKLKLARNFGVFIFRSLTGKFNVVLGTFATEKGISAADLELLHKFYMDELFKIGYEPEFIVCDQASTNRKFYSNVKVTPDNPKMNLGSFTALALYDNPHLFKSVSGTVFFSF